MRHQVNIPANLIPAASGSQIYVFHAGTQVQVADTIYADGSSGSTLANPYSHPGGKVVFYLSRPMPVDIGVKPAGAASPVIAPTVTVSNQIPQHVTLKIGSQPVGWFLQ